MKHAIYFSAGMAILLTGCFAKDSSEVKKEKLQELPVLQLTTIDTMVNTSYVASIQAQKNVEIRTKIGGSLEKILVDEGQAVKEGQALFSLNDKMIRVDLERAAAALENAKADVRSAELELKRTKLLVEKKIISIAEQEMADAKLAGAKARVKEAASAESEASIKLSFTTVRAPFSGIINRIPLKRGSFINEGELLTTVSALDAVYAYFDVSEIEYLKYIKATQAKESNAYRKVKLQLADGSEYPHEGLVETMEGEIDNSTGSIAFRAKFPNPGRILKHGSSGKIALSNRMQNTILVPQKSVFEVQDKNFVFVVNKDSTVEMRDFVPSMKFDKCYIVLSGLEAGETILYEGLQNVKNGTKINPKATSLK